MRRLQNDALVEVVLKRVKSASVCILASESGVLYTAVTSRLDHRIIVHKQKLIDGFSKKYNVSRLVYYELFGDIRDAIARKKQIKGWLRARKVALIASANPKWRDLSGNFLPPSIS